MCHCCKRQVLSNCITNCDILLPVLQLFYSEEDGLVWSGKTRSNITVQPHTETSLEMNVTVFRYGVYDLNTLNISCATGSAAVREHTTDAPTLLIVEKG